MRFVKNKKRVFIYDISQNIVYFVSETLKPDCNGKEERKKGWKTHEER